MKGYAREIVWVGIAQAATFGGGLATVKAAAVVLGPTEYGKLSVALAIVGIAQVCLYGAISQTATRFLAFASASGLLNDYKISLGMLALLAAAVIGLFLVMASVSGLSAWIPLSAAILCAYTIINGTQAILIAVCNAARKRQLVAVVQMAEAIIRPFLIFAIAYLAIRTAENVFLAYLLSTALLVAAIVVAWTSKNKFSLEAVSLERQNADSIRGGRLTWNMMMFSAPFVVFGVLGALGSHGERLLLAKWATWAEVGSYALMAQLAMAPNVLFTSIVNQFYFPLVFQFDPSGTRKVGRSFRLYLLTSILGVVGITIAVAFAGPSLIQLFSTTAFLGQEHLLWFLGLSAGLFCIGQQLVLPGLRLNRPAIYMPAKLAHSLVLLGLSAVLVPKWGINGMGLASLLSSTAYLSATILANVWLKRSLKFGKLGEVQS
jgi:O-antigen/teichoic acid export membrane protein